MNASLLYHTDGARYRPLAGFTPRSLHRARRFFSRACGGRRRLRLPATGASSGRGAGLTRRGAACQPLHPCPAHPPAPGRGSAAPLFCSFRASPAPQTTASPVPQRQYGHARGHRLRSPHRPLSATEDGAQSRRMSYLSETWTFWPRKEAAGVADAMIKASYSTNTSLPTVPCSKSPTVPRPSSGR
jgi:hypothetical protein